MNEEELFCKLFPEYAVNGKPLSPYFDLFESGFEQAEKRIEELEKENAELKEYNKYLRRKRQGGIQKQYNKVAIIKRQDDQLTKAKELVKEYMFCTKGLFEEVYPELIKKAEQFLNSEVEK